MNVACTQCSTVSPAGNRFCGKCGTPLPPSPGNLPASARHRGPGEEPSGWGMEHRAPCWQCGGAVDPTRQAQCPQCGAVLVASGPPPAPAPISAPITVPAPPPAPSPYPAVPTPFGPAPETGPGAGVAAAPTGVAQPAPRRARRGEPLLSGPLLTIVVAIVIVIALAVVGIVAGQNLG